MADAPSVKGRKHGGIKAWNATQLRVFLEAVRSHRLHPAFHLAAHTGMRRGEVLGLRWCDLDLDGGRLSVRLNACVDRVRRRAHRATTAAPNCRPEPTPVMGGDLSWLHLSLHNVVVINNRY